MKGICKAISWLFLLHCAPFVFAAALPASVSTIDSVLLQRANASFATPDILKYRRILLAIELIGATIPKREVVDTLGEAYQIIDNLARSLPDEPIPDDRFEYLSGDGNMIILIAANVGENLTWNELYRIILSIRRFMLGGPGEIETHFNVLEFNLETISRRNIGNGLIWYFHPGKMYQKEKPPLPSVIVNNTLLQSLTETIATNSTTEVLYPVRNTSNALRRKDSDKPAPQNAEPRQHNLDGTVETSDRSEVGKRDVNHARAAPNATLLHLRIPVPIQGTPLTLVITSLHTIIPTLEVSAGLTNALRKIQTFLTDCAHTPIPNIGYWYRDNVSCLWIIVVTSSYQVITWEQLSWTIAGLLQWMKGDHCRELAFEIEGEGEKHLGFGNIGYDPPRTSSFVSDGEV